MGFTAEDYEILSRPFEPHEHKFKHRLTYIDKEAIFDRLIQIDPDFEYGLIGDYIETCQTVMIRGYLIVKGVRRESVGTGSYLTKDSNGQPYSEFNLSREIIGAYKGAATDLLARCAQLFGIGRYLRNTPKHVKDEHSLAMWLKSLGTNATPQNVTRIPPPSAPKTQRRVPAQQPVDNADDSAGFNAKVVSEDLRLAIAYNHPEHVKSTIKKYFTEAGFASMNHGQAVQWLLDHADDGISQNEFGELPHSEAF